MKRVGFFAGVFDVLHAGHILAIKEARQNCDKLIIGLHCCPSYKTPIETIFERYTQLSACKWVDEVIPYTNAEDCKRLIQSLPFDIYFLGEDHEGQRWENDVFVKEMGKTIIYLHRKHLMSSTDIKKRILDAK